MGYARQKDIRCAATLEEMLCWRNREDARETRKRIKAGEGCTGSYGLSLVYSWGRARRGNGHPDYPPTRKELTPEQLMELYGQRHEELE